jgi:hypothetical protein
MNAIPTPGMPRTSRSETADRVRRATALLALTLLMVSVQVAAQEQVAAVWKARKLSFSYGSSTAIYSCSALAGRVASILRAVGARDDIKVEVNDCSESITPPGPNMNARGSMNTWEPSAQSSLDRRTDRQQFVHVNVRSMMPVEVTPEVLAELKRDKSRRELVSRITGNPAAKFNDPILFTAQWQSVTLSRKTIGLSSEECELLDQMSASVFRQLGVREVSRGFSCDPDRLSRIPPELVVEAFLPTPFGSDNAQKTPAAGEEDADPGVPAASDAEPAEPATDKTTE